MCSTISGRRESRRGRATGSGFVGAGSIRRLRPTRLRARCGVAFASVRRDMAKRRRRLYADLDRAMLLRAAKLARLPGVTRAEACERFDLSIGMLRRALRDFWVEAFPAPREIVLHAFTDGGTRKRGELPNLATVASYVDFVNKDGMTQAGVEAIVDELVAEGTLALKGKRWRLLVEWP